MAALSHWERVLEAKQNVGKGKQMLFSSPDCCIRLLKKSSKAFACFYAQTSRRALINPCSQGFFAALYCRTEFIMICCIFFSAEALCTVGNQCGDCIFAARSVNEKLFIFCNYFLQLSPETTS
jgi:hypothetical protein